LKTSLTAFSDSSTDLKKNKVEIELLKRYGPIIYSRFGENNKKDKKEYDFKKLTSVLSEIDADIQKLLTELVNKSEGYVGSDIESVCREAAIFALRENIEAKEITAKHFDIALEKVPPSVNKEIEKTYEDMRESLSAARARQMQEEKPIYMG